MYQIRKAVILAGGLGTRLMPLTRAIPKEMLPLGAKPIVQHIVDEFRAAGLEEILIVSREGKSAIEEHFAGEHGVRVLIKKEALGPGHSVLFAREFLEDESFLVAFGDAPIGGKRAKEFVLDLLRVHESLQAAAVLSVVRIPEGEIHLRAIVRPAGSLKAGVAVPITELVQKPRVSKAPSRWAVAGRYTFSPVLLDSLQVVASRAAGEILLADAIRHALAEERRVYALPLPKGLHRFDTGTLEGYFRAFQAFARGFPRDERRRPETD